MDSFNVCFAEKMVDQLFLRQSSTTDKSRNVETFYLKKNDVEYYVILKILVDIDRLVY